jgi:AraC-like DNA-binding protein
VSFADVLDDARKGIAELYVREPGVALTEIAYLLGFSEPSAFSRAFQRWYGKPPSRYRAELLAREAHELVSAAVAAARSCDGALLTTCRSSRACRGA